jgi:hypothetical protein
MRFWIRRTLAVLEGAEDPVAQLIGVGDRFKTRGEGGILVVAEVAVLNAGGQYEVIVGQWNRSARHDTLHDA